jgi:hypothetical protein
MMRQSELRVYASKGFGDQAPEGFTVMSRTGELWENITRQRS